MLEFIASNALFPGFGGAVWAATVAVGAAINIVGSAKKAEEIKKALDKKKN